MIVFVRSTKPEFFLCLLFPAGYSILYSNSSWIRERPINTMILDTLNRPVSFDFPLVIEQLFVQWAVRTSLDPMHSNMLTICGN